MSDLISRAAVIEAVHDEFDGCLVWDESGKATANEVERIIASLPSAQPEKRTEERTEKHACDCISRQAAIDALCNDLCGGNRDCRFYPDCDNLKPIQALPSAQPEIVRCKDCKHNQLPSTSGNANCEIFYGMNDRNGFCYMAERRTDDQN